MQPDALDSITEILDFKLNGRKTETSMIRENQRASRSPDMGTAQKCAATAATFAKGEEP